MRIKDTILQSPLIPFVTSSSRTHTFALNSPDASTPGPGEQNTPMKEVLNLFAHGETCAHTYTFTYILTHVHIALHTREHVHLFTCTHIHIHTSTHIHKGRTHI